MDLYDFLTMFLLFGQHDLPQENFPANEPAMAALAKAALVLQFAHPREWGPTPDYAVSVNWTRHQLRGEAYGLMFLEHVRTLPPLKSASAAWFANAKIMDHARLVMDTQTSDRTRDHYRALYLAAEDNYRFFAYVCEAHDERGSFITRRRAITNILHLIGDRRFALLAWPCEVPISLIPAK